MSPGGYRRPRPRPTLARPPARAKPLPRQIPPTLPTLEYSNLYSRDLYSNPPSLPTYCTRVLRACLSLSPSQLVPQVRARRHWASDWGATMNSRTSLRAAIALFHVTRRVRACASTLAGPGGRPAGYRAIHTSWEGSGGGSAGFTGMQKCSAPGAPGPTAAYCCNGNPPAAAHTRGGGGGVVCTRIAAGSVLALGPRTLCTAAL